MNTDFIYSIAIVLTFLLGASLFFSRSFSLGLLSFKMRKRLKQKRKEGKEGKLFYILRVSLFTITGKDLSPVLFVLVTAVNAFALSLVTLKFYGVFIGMTVFSSAFLLPYGFLFIKLKTVRDKVSHEAEGFLGSFLSSYRSSECDVLEAISRMTPKKVKAKSLESFLAKLLYTVRNDSSAKSVKKAEAEFSFSVNTKWGKLLSYNMAIGILTGEDISIALEDIFFQMREARVLFEKRKRMNQETIKMVMFLIPAMYAFTVFSARNFIGLTMGEFIRYQFQERIGFMLFMTILLMFLINLMILEYIKNRPLDF